MRVQLVTRFVRPHRWCGVSGLLGRGQWFPVSIPCLARCSAPTLLPPFAPRPLRRLNATMEALTPARLSPAYRSPCFTYSTVQTIPSPTTVCPLLLLYSRYIGLSGTGLLPLYHTIASRDAGPGNRFRLRHCLGGCRLTAHILLKTPCGRFP